MVGLPYLWLLAFFLLPFLIVLKISVSEMEVVSFTPESKMTVGNTAAVFAPNLLRPEHETLEHLKQRRSCFCGVEWQKIFSSEASIDSLTNFGVTVFFFAV